MFNDFSDDLRRGDAITELVYEYVFLSDKGLNYSEDEATLVKFSENPEQQYAGADILVAPHQGTNFCVEVKAAVDNAGVSALTNRPLETFVQELSYINQDGDSKIGWAIDRRKETDVYAFCWIPQVRDGLKPRENVSYCSIKNIFDIEEMDIAIVDAKKLRKSVIAQLFGPEAFENEGAFESWMLDEAQRVREEGRRRNHIGRADVVYSNNLKEKPINLLLPKSVLMAKAVQSFNLRNHWKKGLPSDNSWVVTPLSSGEERCGKRVAMTEGFAKYFDYLDEYGEALEVRLKKSAGLGKIGFWRRQGLMDLDAVAAGCRKIVEHGLNALANKDQAVVNAKLVHKITMCLERGLIDKPMEYKLNEIRKTGNVGAHDSTKLVSVQMALESLDDFLRFLIRKWEIDLDIPLEAVHDLSAIFCGFEEEDAEKLNHKARTAALLSGQKSIESQTRRIAKDAVKSGKKRKEAVKQISELISQAQELGDSLGVSGEQEALFDECDRIVGALVADQKGQDKALVAVEEEIDEILSESDYIKKLLQAAGRPGGATSAQFEVMSFPRTSSATTNTLVLSGSAGTGKTLCLLAKLISDVSSEGQLELEGIERKRALFLCFNASLAGYVRDLLANYPSETLDIEVAHYDEYVNQLIRNAPKKEFEHLAQYATNVRYEYPPAWSVVYGRASEELIEEAMGVMSQRYPDRQGAYYLDASSQENVSWVADELRWLESRYADVRQGRAEYPKATRVGRGSKRQPREDIRNIILEIWDVYQKLLKSNHLYTVEQTTKRLMKANSLPQYDSIAIDEVQDFALASVKLAFRFRKSDRSRVYISGDENQKIYKRDFTWKELGDSVRSHTIVLKENKRNSDAVRRFAERLNGIESAKSASNRFVYIAGKDDRALIELIQAILQRTGKNEKTVLIGNVRKSEELLRSAGISFLNASRGDISKPGLYCVGEYVGKGLEFDNVIVDYDRAVGEDEEEEKRLRYVHFTRARKRLYIRYQGNPPALLQQYYRDFLE